VDEQVRTPGELGDDRRGRRVAREHDLATRARGTEHLLGRDHMAVRERDGLATLQRPPLRPVRHPELVGRLRVKAARTLVLGDRVAHGGHTVVDRKDEQPIVLTVERLAGAQLGHVDLVCQPAEDAAQRPEEVPEPGRPVDREGRLAPAQGERLQHPGEPEVVVRVEVRQEDLVQLDEADRGAQELALRALAAVEEQPLAAPAYEQRRWGPLRGRHRAGRAEEDDVEVHGARSYRRARAKPS
jgi:hypothetical protein